MLSKNTIGIAFLFLTFLGFSQEKEVMNASMTGTSTYMRNIAPLAGKKLIPAQPREGEINPRRTGANKVVPGKGYPKGDDPLIIQQKSAQSKRTSKAPSLIFETGASVAAPSDPTGAIGPNHYVSAKNYSFSIHDRAGNELVGPSSLTNIFPGESLGDPIVFYDSFADRFVITQFSDTPNGFLVAVCQGPDPVNDGWYTYRFSTGTFPDYTKFSVWSDGYYITANKDQGSQKTSEVVYVIERDKMLVGDDDIKMVGLPLPGAELGSGFYSPASFHAIGNTPPPIGDARIIYYQDDGWAGVDQDMLKLWEINVNWVSTSESTISEAEEIPLTAFDSTFDGGSFTNIPQPGSTQDIDVLQGALMYATNYRRFCDYNSVVLNFAVDIEAGDTDDVAGIRWCEIRQNGDGEPWTLYQEGTYTSPDGKSAWCGSMVMDIFGNIGMGYTTMGTTATGANADSFASIRYTGRLASDPLGTMTFAEETIATGTDIQRNGGDRYGDYAQITVDPVDDQTFWHIAEYFTTDTENARNVVGVFKIAEDVTTDVGVISIDAPLDNITYTDTETITVSIKNFGSTAQSDIPVTYSVNNGTDVTEMFTGPLAAGETVSFSFATTVDLSGQTDNSISAETGLVGDLTPDNNCSTRNLIDLLPVDVGVGELINPAQDGEFSAVPEPVTITIYNYSGTEVTDIPVFYILNNGDRIDEIFEGTIPSQEEVEYTFTTLADLTEIGTYVFELGTDLDTDQNNENDSITRTITRADAEICKPTSDCIQYGDGTTYFELANVINSEITCSTGYEDFSQEFIIALDLATPTYTVTVQSGYADENGSERISIWIDFDDSNTFETSELILDNEILEEFDVNQVFTFTLSSTATLGTHLLRIRGGDVNQNSGDSLNEPCGSMSFGTTHDYTVEIIDNTVTTATNTDLVVVSEPDNQFTIIKTDSGSDTEKRIYIFNVLGQVIASNQVKKDDNNTYIYTLDMSYAATGVYFARLGNDKKSEATQFIVQ
ncbi:GEVED domain-containing protein [Aquimarina pacifica]|uniref:GEVED domain-containing protein n=1 Tax=Aquimarina pacifica TaxID=1296415 RepID=UPI00046FF383|nr:GEVED domain-containing protein [Aquimarina pacifica]